ncbi:MAG: hypothetical protein ACLGI6_00290 [Gammaproteobacteria bacterium]
MTLTQQDCARALADMSTQELALFLARLGHMCTIFAREAYEFQGPGVTDPYLLRDFNELHHRVYSQLAALLRDSQAVFPPEALASWLSGEGRSETFRAAAMNAFESCFMEFSGDQ